jgi:hypothetical protein
MGVVDGDRPFVKLSRRRGAAKKEREKKKKVRGERVKRKITISDRAQDQRNEERER